MDLVKKGNLNNFSTFESVINMIFDNYDLMCSCKTNPMKCLHFMIKGILEFNG